MLVNSRPRPRGLAWKPDALARHLNSLHAFVGRAAYVLNVSVDFIWSALSGLAKVLTFVIAIDALIFGSRKITRANVAIEPIAVSKEFSDLGITSEAMAERIMDELARIQAGTKISIRGAGKTCQI
jgi:hypothetical protein